MRKLLAILCGLALLGDAALAQQVVGGMIVPDGQVVSGPVFRRNGTTVPSITTGADANTYIFSTPPTASFLPKPVTGVNGSGMHTNMSLSRGGVNLFFDKGGEASLSQAGWDFIGRILQSGDELCLVLNPSVNAYRRLDPHFEAPNQIKASPTDRGSMVRIPIGNERSMRIEVRSVAPDANPYMALYALLRTGMEGPVAEEDDGRRPRTRFLSDNIYDAARLYKGSRFLQEILGEDVHGKFAELKLAQAERCPKALGTTVKDAEIQYHHEVTNQYLWSLF